MSDFLEIEELKRIIPYIDNMYNTAVDFEEKTPKELGWDNNFDLNKIKEDFHTEPCEEGMLMLVKDADDFLIEYYLFDRQCGSHTSETLHGGLIYYGYGMSGNLREMRHTYFNPYLYYIPASTIEASFKELRKYFDI